MIISASYRTDIPAFYAEWFLRRLRLGWCTVVNPYNRRQVSRIDLSPHAVDGFVFWTKNLGPFGAAIDAVAERGTPFVVHYSINGYPRAIERSVPEPDRAIAHVRALRERFGPRAAVWRYDPILFSSLTPAAIHRENFGRIASALRGCVDEAVVSFAQIYRKTRRGLDAAAAGAGFEWADPDPATKRALLADLVALASENDMRLTVCSQPELADARAGEARCIDAARLADVAGRSIAAPEHGNRPGCLCHRSRDIGGYDTCPQGCVYCYAVRDRAIARSRYRDHDPASDCLAPDGTP